MNNKKGFTKILLVIIAIIAIVLIVYIKRGYREMIPSDIKNNEKKEVTNDWKIYRNDKYGFETKYPTGYEFSENYSKDDIGEFSVAFFNSKLKSEIETAPASDRLPPMITIRYAKSNNMGWAETLYKFFGSDTQIKLLRENPEEIKNFAVTSPIKFIVEPVLFLPSGYAFRINNYDIFIYVPMDTNEESKMNLEKMLPTLRFTKNESNITVSSDNNGNVKEQPGIVKQIQTTSVGWLLTVDYVSRNPKWLPGVGNEPFFLNTNNKLRKLLVSNNETNGKTKFFKCGGNETVSYGPVIEAKIEDFIGEVKKELLAEEPVYYFDVKDETIDAVYTKCLP